MKSARGFAAATVLLLALPLALLYQLLGGTRVEVVIHALLALGATLLALAVFDFRAPRWITLVGAIAIGALALIFLTQGVSELIANPGLRDVVYRVLGQRIEGWLVDLFLLWCVAVLLTDSGGRTRAWGFAALAVAIAVELYANWIAYRGTSLSDQAPALKLLILLPCVWILLESRKEPVTVTR